MTAAQAPPPPQPATATVAIIYDGPDLPLADGFLGAHYIKNLLGHFALRGELIRLADYRPGELSHYRAAFYVGSVAETVVPPGFLRDVRSSKQPFCWLGRHIDQLLAVADAQRQFGFRYYRTDQTAWRVSYKDAIFPRDDFNLSIVEPADGRTKVVATAVQSDNTTRPYVLNRNRFWYFADTPLVGAQEEGSRYLVFCDLLHDILEIYHASQSAALVRMEDVSAEADAGDLRAVADALSRRNAPFQIATIPLYRNPLNKVEMRLSDRPKVVDAIHYMIDRGGTPVMHGWSHQYYGSTGDDYEFWDGIKNAPIAGDSEEEIANKLNAGLAELFTNKLFPVAFETPHYAASPIDYRAMQRHFKLFNERTMPTPNLVSVQYFPYPVIDEFGRYVVPENLGYIPMEKPDPKLLIENARYMRVVRDGVPSFYFHPFLDVKLLDQALQGITDLGYHFISLREFGGEVNDQGRYFVRTQSGPVQLSPHGEFCRLRRFDSGGKLLAERTAPTPLNVPVKIDVDVAPGGWAALDCFEKAPQRGRLTQAIEELKGWWAQRATRTRSQDATAYEQPREAWILWQTNPSEADANNQASYRTALDTFGFAVRPVPLQEFAKGPQEKKTLLVVPQGLAALLTGTQQQEILRYLSSGGVVLADGPQPWLSTLGLRRTGWHLPVSEVQETLIEGTSFSWEPEELVERYTPPLGSKTLQFETDTKQPVAFAGRYGRGYYVYLAAPLDTHTRDGLSRYPYLAEYLADTFHMRSILRGGRLETYFDPGFRRGVNPDNLASYWKEAGIRTVYVAAWQFYDRYTFDYAALIRACHRNGISVYAWLMFPQLTPLMWQQHPEWREQAAVGGDGRPGWRYLMNLQNPACFRAAMDWAKNLLHSQDWDGINIAELNFDAAHPDYLRPDRFVPMNNEVRSDFRKKAGFDPAQLFVAGSPYYHERNPKALAKFLRYREDIVTGWHRRVLTELDPVARERGLEVIVTAMDSLHSKYVQPALGVNSRRIAALMQEFDFTLQVEDPVEHWAEPPDRYKRFAKDYRKIVPDERRLMFDMNVVSDREIGGTSLPSTIARGTELARTVMAAAVSGRVAIYAENTVEPEDWPVVGSALARPAEVTVHESSVEVDSPLPVFLNSPQARAYSLDGQTWPAESGGVLIPSGHHRLLAASALGLRMFRAPSAQFQSLSCDLLDADVMSTGLVLRYTSPGRAAIVLTQRPEEILVDGHRTSIPVNGRGDEWVILAPRGEHRLEITTLTRAGLAINWSSWILSSVIVAFGASATLLMLWLYIRLRVNPAVRWRRSEG
jgi:uncharacterized protein YdaL